MHTQGTSSRLLLVCFYKPLTCILYHNLILSLCDLVNKKYKVFITACKRLIAPKFAFIIIQILLTGIHISFFVQERIILFSITTVFSL